MGMAGAGRRGYAEAGVAESATGLRQNPQGSNFRDPPQKCKSSLGEEFFPVLLYNTKQVGK